MTTQTRSEELKDFIAKAKTQVAYGLVPQTEIDRWEAELKYTVSAGGYEGDGEISTDYIDSFATIEDAMAANRKYGSDQPWSRIELRDGEFIYEIEPVRIMRRDPTTGFFNRCSDDGSVIVDHYRSDDKDDNAETPSEFEIEDAIGQLNSVHSHNDLMLILSGFPMDIIRRMAEVQELNDEDHLQSCDQLAMELDKGELADLLRESAEHCGYC
jgi:hypothetical protein